MSISVIGLGKLGLCTSACLAGEGLDVIGYDINPDNITKLNCGECYIDEPGLTDKLKEVFDKKFMVTNDIYHAILESNSSFIIVPTPSKENGFFSNDAIMDALNKIVPALKETTMFHVVNIVSTVMPGSCHNFIKFLEHETGKKCGVDFGLTYNPEFIAIGTVIRNFLNPDMVLVGGSDKKSIGIIANCYTSFCHNIRAMSLINAELTKLSLNCFLTMKISFANEVAALCEKVPGANVDAITNAIGEDSRIGDKFLRAGLGFAGPCLPRDTVAFSSFSKQCGYMARIPDVSNKINKDVIDRIIEKIVMNTPHECIVDIYGSSYKSGTKLTEGSQSIILQNKLLEMGYVVRMIDNESSTLGLSFPHAIVVMSDSVSSHSIDNVVTHNCVFIDPWRRFSYLKGICCYYAMGVGNEI